MADTPNYDDVLASVKKLNQTRQEIKSKMAGMEDELESTQRAYRQVADDIDEIMHLMDETDDLIGKMDSEFKELKTFMGSGGRQSQFSEEIQKEESELESDVQGYARLARKIHENLQRLEELTENAREVTQEQTVVFKEVLQAEKQIDAWDEEMENMDKSVINFMENMD